MSRRYKWFSMKNRPKGGFCNELDRKELDRKEGYRKESNCKGISMVYKHIST